MFCGIRAQFAQFAYNFCLYLFWTRQHVLHISSVLQQRFSILDQNSCIEHIKITSFVDAENNIFLYYLPYITCIFFQTMFSLCTLYRHKDAICDCEALFFLDNSLHVCILMRVFNSQANFYLLHVLL